MFTIPCSTESCSSPAMEGMAHCIVCHDRVGFPEGYSRKRDEAWLAYKTCHEIRFIPIKDPGCNSHPVTPRPDICPACPGSVEVAA